LKEDQVFRVYPGNIPDTGRATLEKYAGMLRAQLAQDTNPL
jgi:hypothetical protein